MDTPVGRVAKVFRDSFKTLVMDVSGSLSEFCKGDQGKANVGATGHIGIEKLA